MTGSDNPMERMPQPRGPEAPESRPEPLIEPEGAAEIGEEIEALALEVESSPAAIADRTTKEIARVEADADLSPSELKDDPDAEAAKSELAALDAQATAAAAATKRKAGGLLPRLRKFAGAAGVAAAMSFLEACATMGGARQEAGIEHVEKTPPRPLSEVEGEVEASLAEGSSNQDLPELKAKLGQENLEIVRGVYGGYDIAKVTDVFAQMSGV